VGVDKTGHDKELARIRDRCVRTDIVPRSHAADPSARDVKRCGADALCRDDPLAANDEIRQCRPRTGEADSRTLSVDIPPST